MVSAIVVSVAVVSVAVVSAVAVVEVVLVVKAEAGIAEIIISIESIQSYLTHNPKQTRWL